MLFGLGLLFLFGLTEGFLRPWLDAKYSAAAWLQQVQILVWVAVVLLLLIGGVEALIQRNIYLRGKRMSYQDAKDEQKEAEGNPEMRARRLDMARSRSAAVSREAVSEATVIVVNPTHFAVALKYDGPSSGIPTCVAKGTDHLAFRVRQFAAEAGVPVYSDPPLARLLHAEVDVGAPVQETHYRAVAAAIRFAQRIRSRKSS